jgi:hypothetical protein
MLPFSSPYLDNQLEIERKNNNLESCAIILQTIEERNEKVRQASIPLHLLLSLVPSATTLHIHLPVIPPTPTISPSHQAREARGGSERRKRERELERRANNMPGTRNWIMTHTQESYIVPELRFKL